MSQGIDEARDISSELNYLGLSITRRKSSTYYHAVNTARLIGSRRGNKNYRPDQIVMMQTLSKKLCNKAKMNGLSHTSGTEIGHSLRGMTSVTAQ